MMAYIYRKGCAHHWVWVELQQTVQQAVTAVCALSLAALAHKKVGEYPPALPPARAVKKIRINRLIHCAH